MMRDSSCNYTDGAKILHEAMWHLMMDGRAYNDDAVDLIRFGIISEFRQR
jgi:hypothetical protein